MTSNITVKESFMKAYIERCSEVEYRKEGQAMRLFVFQRISPDGRSHYDRIQNWECDDITGKFTLNEIQEIEKACNARWATL